MLCEAAFGTQNALAQFVPMDKLITVLLCVLVAVVPGGLFLFPVLAHRILNRRRRAESVALGPVSEPARVGAAN